MPDKLSPGPGLGIERPNCFGCRYFAVSWDPRLPYMCQQMGFKSRNMPCLEVLRIDGSVCQGFTPKSRAASLQLERRSPAAGCTVEISGLKPR